MAYFQTSNVKCEEKFEPEHCYVFTGKCITTGEEQTVAVRAPDLYKYNQGELMQNCFPYLHADDREWLISGLSGKGWDKLFGN